MIKLEAAMALRMTKIVVVVSTPRPPRISRPAQQPHRVKKKRRERKKSGGNVEEKNHENRGVPNMKNNLLTFF